MLLGAIFLFIVCIPLILLIFFIDKVAAKPKGNMILGATVPLSKIDNKELLNIVEEYKKYEKRFIIAAFITSVPVFFMPLKSTFLAVAYLFLWTIFILLGENSCLKKAFNKIQLLKEKNNWFIEGIPDEDKYWSGLIYNNPNDKRFMVEKRVGIGTTVNFAHPAGKAFTIGLILVLIGTLVPAGVMMYKLSNAEFNLTVEDGRVSIDAPFYDFSFGMGEIEGVETISKMPGVTKTNGATDTNLLLGNFKVSGYGTSKVYVKKDVEEIVVVKLKDMNVFITGDSAWESEEYFKVLKEK